MKLNINICIYIQYFVAEMINQVYKYQVPSYLRIAITPGDMIGWLV